jgi:hypothetical protein
VADPVPLWLSLPFFTGQLCWLATFPRCGLRDYLMAALRYEKGRLGRWRISVRNQLFGIQQRSVFLSTDALLIVLVSISVALLPARRAAKVNRIVALHYE